MKRETIKIDKEILQMIIFNDSSKMKKLKIPIEYEMIENKITSADTEDGGADHTVVIKRLSDDKYFSVDYSDWDMEYNFDRDFPETLSEVFPKQITITIFE